MIPPMILLFALLALQQTPAPPPEIARIVVLPTGRTMTAGDTLRLTAEARDAQNNIIPDVTFRYRLGNSARFEARVDSLGLVTAGSTATLPVTVTATLAGARPKFETIEIKALPGPAASIEIAPGTAKLVAGQRLRLAGRVFSATGDKRSDVLTWRSSNPSVATVNAMGLVSAVSAGSANIIATIGRVSKALPVQVVGGAIASLSLTPSNVAARTGDVLRFGVTA